MADIKRFYTLAAVAEAAEGYCITLDGRPIRTPAARQLVVPHLPLAEEIASEWLAQGEKVIPATMPMTQLASTALDRVGPLRPAMVDELIHYAASDLLCHRAASPQDLVAREEAVWQPIIDWASVELGVEMVVGVGILPIQQPQSSFEVLRRTIENYDDLHLTALQSAVVAMGSLLLGLALMRGRLSVEESFAASQLNETYQIELWGEDYEATQRRDILRNEIAWAARFIELCLPRTPPMRS
jgi:chaperone required for assembly of F1-ATPase